MNGRALVFERRGRPPLRAVLGPVIADGGTAFIHEARVVSPARGAPSSIVVKCARQGARRFFESERATCERFEHRNLVSYVGSAEDPDLGPVLGLERLAGNPFLLAQRSETRCSFRDPGTPYYPLPPGIALELAFDLLLALEHLHGEGHVHADVKLANFLIRTPRLGEPRETLAQVARGEFEGVLIDLGSVRSAEWAESTRRGMPGAAPRPAITPIYAPPETVLERGAFAERLTPSMDTYAFALVFYAFLTGRPAYSSLIASSETRDPAVLASLKAREARGEISPFDEAALDDLALHDTFFERGMATGWPAFRSGVAHLLRRLTDRDPAARMDAKEARAFFEQELGIRRAEGGTRAWRQSTFRMCPRANRLTGDRPVGQIRIRPGKDASPAPTTESRQIGRVLSEIRRTGTLPGEGPFAVVTTGASGPDLLVSSVHDLGPWLGEAARSARSVTIGRDPGNTIVVADPRLSRRHAELTRDDEGRVAVADLGSSNGTTVEHSLVAPGERRALPRGSRTVDLGPATTLTLVDARELEGFLEATLRSAIAREQEPARVRKPVRTAG